METLLIHGCGGHARSVAAAVKERWRIVFVDANAKPGETILGCPVFREADAVPGVQNAFHHVATGDLEAKRTLFEKLLEAGCQFPVLIAPGAMIAAEAVLEPGVFVGAGAYVGPKAQIGGNAIVNTHAVVEHDAVIGRHSHVSIQAAVAGYSQIGTLTMLGAGATVIDNVTVGDRITIGAGAVVVHDLPEPGTYVGVPARKLR